MSHPALPPLHLSVSIVAYNSSLDLLQCALGSLCRAAEEAIAAGLDRVTVDVIDNASATAYSRELEDLLAGFPLPQGVTVKLVAQRQNRGFGAGHNTALASLDSDYHLILNPDAELEPDALVAGLSKLARAPDVVLLSPRVTSGHGSQEFLCKRYPSVLVLFLRAFVPRGLHRPFARQLAYYQMEDACSGSQPVEVPLASGCCMLLRSADFRAVDGFDDNYFLYFEDFDLSLRLASRGRLLFDPAMRIVHHGGYAARKGLRHVRLFINSALRFFRQHGWRWI